MAPVPVTRFTFAVDLDGVVANYHQAFANHCATRLGLPTAGRPVPDTWNYSDAWPDVFGDQQAFYAAHADAVDAGLFRTIEPLPGAVEGLQALSDAEIHTRIVTSRLVRNGQHALVAAQTVGWLDDHQIPYRSLALERDDKRQIRAEMAVDDAPVNVTAWRGVGVPCVVFDQPYNRHLGGLRVTTWESLVDIVLRAQQWWLDDPLAAARG